MRKDVRNEIIRIGGDNINKSEMARIMGCSRQTIYNREERLKKLWKEAYIKSNEGKSYRIIKYLKRTESSHS